MAKKKKVLSSLEIEKAARRSIEKKMQKTSFKNGDVAHKTGTTLDQFVPVVDQKIEELKEQLITEQETTELHCMSTKTKVVVVLVLLALLVYYFIS